VEHRDDAGLTLIELIVSVVLLGMAGTAVLGALGATIRGSHALDQQVRAGTVLLAASEQLQRAAYVPCPHPEDPADAYRVAVEAAPAEVGWPADAISITGVRYWDVGAQAWSNTPPPCADTSTISPSAHLQEVALVLGLPGGTSTRTLVVVKSHG
jgi:prepilin-type N-terminal cleavage/methylation domain-containing protein